MSKINNYIVNYHLINEFDIESLKTSQCVPICKDDFLLTVAVCDDSNLEYIQSKYHLPLEKINVGLHEINFLLQEPDLKRCIYENALCSVEQKEASTSFINEFLEALITFSIKKNSSDIHIETHQKSVSIRFRIDGILQHFFRFEVKFYGVLSSVIKLLGSMDITQKRKPQNGRFTKQIGVKSYDFRVSVMPTINGESIVLRILDTKSVKKELSTLGFETNALKTIQKLTTYTQGLVLVTGPTGSGKTTTLYSILEELNTVHKKIITIEDPVEYYIPNIQQVAVNNEIDLGFAEVLKDILRQDPDVIMIGEIRDTHSLKIAIQAALTGHLVLATLHANDAVSTITRLLDLGAESYLIASTLKAVVSQRLALKLCHTCKRKVQTNSELYYEASACEQCNLTGYKNRLMLYEILCTDEHIASLITQNASSLQIKQYAKDKGVESLLENGYKQVYKGNTTLHEVYKVTAF